jgi:SAM-dependent methyltransferase
LFPYVSTIRGIDVSDTMIEKYNEWASFQDISKERMCGFQGDLLAPSAELVDILHTAEYSSFDNVVISMALHHVADPTLLLKKLVAQLTEGGRILIIDWNKKEGDTGYAEPASGSLLGADWKDIKRTIKHPKFNESEVTEMLKVAGCKEVEFVLSSQVTKLPAEVGGEERLFFGLGKK